MTLLEQVRRCRRMKTYSEDYRDALYELDLDALEAALVDAERYRWLRHAEFTWPTFQPDEDLPEGEAFDALIDAARAK